MVTAFFLRAKKLRKKERERTVTNNRLAEMKLNALQSQMNPHFIFNVLNSIQDSFISNQVVEANKYLSDFSSLMRLFLESSDDKYISLEKEIKLLTYYIELEIMRLENKFSFEFRISEDLETDEVFIPTMLLQPIVENAIIHGIRYKEGPVQLIIAFSLRPDEKLHISIKDNGVGRERSAEINRNRRNDHVSKATGIVKERIEIINNSSVGFIDMKYVDLSENGTATGTKVELMMQLDVNR
jgi:sensor histidine kinase YesM